VSPDTGRHPGTRGELEANLMPAPLPILNSFWRRFGFAALGIGISLIVLILRAMIFSYR